MATIWKRVVCLDALNAQSTHTLVAHVGIIFTAVGDDYLEATMPVDSRTQQPFGLLHGGASVVLAETLGSVAGYLASEDGSRVLGIEVNASHHRAVSGGLVRGICRPLHVGKRNQTWQIEIRHEQDKLCCSARLTVAVLAQP
ncbi:hotdog fold thioesterase [Pantoea ananatis]|uniref:hotdog fold thioesterase n=1 Tax=Pantoea ananas TaxID=553 RepID=UPI001B30388A|nr:hotdog fold thioesterase [Pantoea ananatis]